MNENTDEILNLIWSTAAYNKRFKITPFIKLNGL